MVSRSELVWVAPRGWERRIFVMSVRRPTAVLAPSVRPVNRHRSSRVTAARRPLSGSIIDRSARQPWHRAQATRLRCYRVCRGCGLTVTFRPSQITVWPRAGVVLAPRTPNDCCSSSRTGPSVWKGLQVGASPLPPRSSAAFRVRPSTAFRVRALWRASHAPARSGAPRPGGHGRGGSRCDRGGRSLDAVHHQCCYRADR